MGMLQRLGLNLLCGRSHYFSRYSHPLNRVKRTVPDAGHPAELGSIQEYVIGQLVLLSAVLTAAHAVIDPVLGLVKLNGTVKALPVLGTH